MKLFAGFIMTYNRSEILKDTIAKIFEQTLTPEKLLIIDGSENYDSRTVVDELSDSRLEYMRIGYNAGPAGAAKIGLQKLSDEGYTWIYWGDDDDPPNFSTAFETLLKLTETCNLENIGMLGVVGQYFNSRTGEIVRVTDAELLTHDYLKIDSIAGNQSMLINSSVIKKGVLPDERLFFGFEELDFCLKVKKAGFHLLVPTNLFYESRKKYNRLGLKQTFYFKKDEGRFNREYYSVRNILLILKNQKLYVAWCYQFIKNMLKCFYGFRFGWRYGVKNFNMVSLGVYHALINKSGKVL